MRRLLSILLFAATLLPLLAPFLSIGAAAQSSLPACCRREGKHHCAMGDMALPAEAKQQRQFQAPHEMCPYQQRAVTPAHHEHSAITESLTKAAVVLHEPSAAGQAECLRRISFDRSRQKRGPPSLLS